MFAGWLPTFKPQLIESLKTYTLSDFRADAAAGLVVGIVALPLAMAFAIASGVSPQSGIVTAMIAGFLISALGGTRLCIGGPTGAFIVILYGIAVKYGVANLLVCTFMAGVMLVLMGLSRLGQIIKFFPMPLITGFTNGIAVLIFLSQLKDFFGLPVEKMPSGFFATLQTLSHTLPHFAPLSLGMAGACLAFILLWPKKLNALLPAPFVALILASLAVHVLDLPLATIGSAFGGIPQGLPPVQGLVLDWANLSNLLAPAFTIALLGAIESLLCAVVADGMTGDKHDTNQELIAQGIANMVVPFFGGIAATGAIARTATNVNNGARSPVAGIIHALLLLVIMLVAAPLARFIPLTVLAAILVAVAFKMGDWDIRKALYFPKRDTFILVVTFALTVIFDLTVAVEIGLLMSAIFFIQRMARNTGVHKLEPDHGFLFERHSIAGKTLPVGCEAYRVEGALFFGAADSLERIQTSDDQVRVVILQLHRLVMLDTTGMLAMSALHDKLAEAGKTLILCGAGGAMGQMLVDAKLATHVGERNVQPDLAAALVRAEELLRTKMV